MGAQGPVLASVIILAYNAITTLPGCLRALARQSLARHQFEVIVVADASTDGTARAGESAAVRVIRQPVNAGPAAARNLGARAARGELLVFTDADCEPTVDFLERILAPLLADRNVAGVKGTYLSRQPELMARFVQLEYEDRYRRMLRLFGAQGAIDFIDTYAAAFRRVDFLAARGFDEAFPTASVEDQELSFRLAATGKRLVFAPDARVMHRGHATTLYAYARKKYNIGYWKGGRAPATPGEGLPRLPHAATAQAPGGARHDPAALRSHDDPLRTSSPAA